MPAQQHCDWSVSWSQNYSGRGAGGLPFPGSLSRAASSNEEVGRIFFRALAAAAVAVGFVVAALPFASATALLLPPSARADDPDDAFIAGLHHKGVQVDKRTTPPPSPPQLSAGADQFVAALIDHGAEVTDSNTAVRNAHWVCGFLSNGFTRREVAGAVRPKMRYTQAQAATFVDLSIDYYCPEYRA